MFYAVLALLNLRGLGSSKHSGAIALFDREFVKTGIFNKELSNWIHDAFARRQRSDYAEMVVLAPQDAEETLGHARRFVESAAAHLAREMG